MEDAGSIWSVLWPVIIGGVLTLIASTVSPIAASWWEYRQNKKSLQSERLEKLFMAVFAHDQWLEHKRMVRCFGSEDNNSPEPLSQAFLLANLYFTELLPALRLFRYSAKNYEVWMFAAQQKRITHGYVEAADGFLDAYNPYNEAFQRVQSEIAGQSKLI